MAMTSQELAKLRINKKLSAKFITLVDGFGWTYKELVYLIDAGITPQEIADSVQMGISYDQIKYVADTKKLDAVEHALFDKPVKLDGDSPVINAINITSKATNLLSHGLYKLGRLIYGR